MIRLAEQQEKHEAKNNTSHFMDLSYKFHTVRCVCVCVFSVGVTL